MLCSFIYLTQTRSFGFCILFPSLLGNFSFFISYLSLSQTCDRVFFYHFFCAETRPSFLSFSFCLYLSIYLATLSLFQDCMYVIRYNYLNAESRGKLNCIFFAIYFNLASHSYFYVSLGGHSLWVDDLTPYSRLVSIYRPSEFGMSPADLLNFQVIR